MISGYYYLHENGSLIYKPGSESVMDIRDSDFARALWPMDPSNRAGAWAILVEGAAAGASIEDVRRLAERWGCDDKDGLVYANVVGVSVAPLDGGFSAAAGGLRAEGPSVLEALVGLARTLGYRPAKMWGQSFASLVLQTAERTS